MFLASTTESLRNMVYQQTTSLGTLYFLLCVLVVFSLICSITYLRSRQHSRRITGSELNIPKRSLLIEEGINIRTNTASYVHVPCHDVL